jgi:asparagine synthase (glutamine-hydrolysing)
MEHGYQGGIGRRDSAGLPAAISSFPAWTAAIGGLEAALRASGNSRLWCWDELALVVRGHVCDVRGSDPDRIAEGLRCHYLEHGELGVDGLDGSFSVAFVDAAAGRVLLYRNLVGAGFTYYHASGERFLFGSNLADLVDASGVTLRPNTAALPGFFLYRWVSGAQTLFEGFYRLLPGEEVCWEAGRLRRRQRDTFADLRGPVPMGDPIEALEATLQGVLDDYARAAPEASNLLSGGIDSSYLQALWNRRHADLPTSFSLSIDHPRSWADTDYAVTASRWLGTRHVLVPADDAYSAYLLETLAATGEPPNHVQTAYFGRLAQAMVERGVEAGICGEGADSLFGLEMARAVDEATTAQRLVPARWLRRFLGKACGLVGWGWVRDALLLANHLDDRSDPQHPVNQVATFTDRAAVVACFGADAVADAAAERWSLLEYFGVTATLADQVHMTGFLCEAMDSASLWTTLFHRAGADLFCPFLDSRVLRFALSLPATARYPFRRPKDLLRRALARHAPQELVRRPKLGFGQPIFEWLRPGGQLRGLVEAIGDYDFVDRSTLQRVSAEPTWFLSSLLCYDLWHKRFIDRTLDSRPPKADAAAAPVAIKNSL